MANYTFPAIFSKEEAGNYSIFFPDLEHCFTGGDDVNDGMMMANDVLASTLVDMEDDGERIPRPSPIESIKTKDNEFVTLVWCNTDDYRRAMRDLDSMVEKVITMPKWLARRFDETGEDPSELIQRVLMDKLVYA